MLKSTSRNIAPVQPIIILGRQRSGTTWLANLLSNHSKVSSVRHNKHFGIVESNLVSQHFEKLFGDLRVDENRRAFLATFTETNYFELTGESKEWLYALEEYNYNRIFRILMDRFAERKSTPYWLQKAYSLNFEDIYEDFKDAKYLIIQRSLSANIKSTLLRESKGKALSRTSLFKSVVAYFTVRRYENSIAKKHSIPIVKYENLKGDTPEALKNVCHLLGLKYESGMENLRFRRNTTFKNGVHSIDFTLVERSLITVAKFVAGVLPLWFLTRLKKFKKRYFPKNRKFIQGSFSDLSEKRLPKEEISKV